MIANTPQHYAPHTAPLVQILLSTYNGERFLKEQLDSLLTQDYPNIRVLVRDDGSSDGTLRVLEPYLSERVELLRGSNIGVVQSFFALLGASSPEAAFIAFCDQDDVWFPHKVYRAVQALEGIKVPALYCSRLILADGALTPVGHTPLLRRAATFANSLVENVAIGCTTVLNREARSLLIDKPPSLEATVMHDWWFYQVVSALGRVIYDPEPSILYRQHGANVLGAKVSLWGKWRARAERLGKKAGPLRVVGQVAQLQALFGTQLTAEQSQLLEHFLAGTQTWSGRFRSALCGGFYRQSRLDDLILRTLIVIRRF